MRDRTRLVVTKALIKAWGLTPDEGDYLLELRSDNKVLAELLTIRGLLNALFRSLDVENQWLREPKKMLDGKAPMELILSGKDGVAKVEQIVRYMSGQ